MRFSFLIFVILIASIIGCSTAKNYYIDPVYSENKVQAQVLVLPLQRNWFEGNFSHTFGSLSGTAENTFYNSLEPLISENVYSRIRVIDEEQTFDEEMFEPAKLKMGKNSVNVLIPASQSNFSLSDFKPEIVLVLDQYFFRKQQKASSGSCRTQFSILKPTTFIGIQKKMRLSRGAIQTLLCLCLHPQMWVVLIITRYFPMQWKKWLNRVHCFDAENVIESHIYYFPITCNKILLVREQLS